MVEMPDLYGGPQRDVEAPERQTLTAVDNGRATDGGNSTLEDTTKDWETDAWAGQYYVLIVGGRGKGQQRRITSNTSNELTIDGTWTTNPTNTSVYVILAVVPGTGTAPSAERIPQVTVYNSTGTGAISLSTTETGRFRLIQVTIKFDTLPTTAEDITLTLNANDGAAYDAVLARVDPSTGDGTGDVVIHGNPEEIYESGDQLDLAYTNTDGNTFGARIVVAPA